MYEKILVPLDGSSFGEHALPTATELARRFGSSLELVHVHVSFLPASYVEAMPTADSWEESARGQEREYLRELAESLDSDQVRVGFRLLEGPVVKTLAGRIEESGVDLVVMTTHGRGVLERAWLGSVADGLIRESPAPVLLLRPPAEPVEADREAKRFRHVLVPLDESPLSTEILAHARALGEPDGARFTLFTAVAPPMLVAMRYPGGTVPLEPSELELREGRAADRLRAISEPLRERGIDVETVVTSHPQPAAAILEYAREHAVDLIALATHGRRPLARAFLGSVADKLVRGAESPVLVFRPADGED